MQTAVTELFGCAYPVLLSGMTGISTPELVAAVNNAGGLGILATADLTVSQTREALKKIRRLTDRPFGANIPLMIPGSAEKAKILIEEKVKVINYTLGSGERLIDQVHQYGGTVIATVTTEPHALSAQKYGSDALIVTGHEAAAHGGQVTSMVLVPSIVDAVKIPVIAAGGFGDGRGLAAALALGAEGVAMGTRFMNTVESPAHPNMKQMSNQKSVYDTVYSDRIDGLPCRAIDSNGTQKLIKDRLYMLRAFSSSRELAKAFDFPWIKALLGILFAGFQTSKQLARMSNAFQSIRLAIEDGECENGCFLMGQVTGLIHETPTVAQVMESVVQEALAVQKRMTEKLA